MEVLEVGSQGWLYCPMPSEGRDEREHIVLQYLRLILQTRQLDSSTEERLKFWVHCHDLRRSSVIFYVSLHMFISS